jgi:UDP-N-acetylglucosamine--N-acetylmuramyl-(pentapeptide) pyrophosphoryl-undecaprenol N-acetylglucosamine transferase
VIPSATWRGRDPLAVAKTVATLGVGVAKAYVLLRRLRPAAVVGFGGYPSIPPVLAGTLRGIPTVIHEQNGVMGRANRLLAWRATAIATGFAGVLDAAPALAGKATFTGNPLRPAVLAAAQRGYEAPDPEGVLTIVVFGGSQGARIMGEVVPPALDRLSPTLRGRLRIVQQARQEDLSRVRDIYVSLGVAAEVAPFFADLPARIAAAQLIVARAGASTVAELAAIGRPAILVPLPHALDQDQLANASMLSRAGGAILIKQDVFTPERLADELASLAAAPEKLATMAAAARAAGTLDGAQRLAELVVRVAGISAAQG